MGEKFAVGASSKIIASMKSQVEANSHMFSKKQQEYLRSSAFKPADPEQRGRSVEGGSDRRDDKSRHRRTDADRRSPERRKSPDRRRSPDRRKETSPQRGASRSRSRSGAAARRDRSRSPAGVRADRGRRCDSRSRSASSRKPRAGKRQYES